MILLADVYSTFHKGNKPILYGKKGQEVKEISQHGEVLIVEAKNGSRFPVHIKHTDKQLNHG